LATTTNKKILTFDELPEHGVNLGRKQLARLEAAGKFPQRIQVSEHRIGWLAEEIKAHVDAQIEQRNK